MTFKLTEIENDMNSSVYDLSNEDISLVRHRKEEYSGSERSEHYCQLIFVPTITNS